ncbi:MAG TPA: hypothetical protein VM095_02060 [Pyrinomonadaceae bacterium]|nr:hypothetical protein [Pyrinomonadaceae bacterium]
MKQKAPATSKQRALVLNRLFDHVSSHTLSRLAGGVGVDGGSALLL